MTTPTIAHPTTGELVGAPRPGVCVWSKTRRYADDPEYQSPVGGHIINIRPLVLDGDDDPPYPVDVYETIDWRWNHAVYSTVTDLDVDWDAYDGGIRPKAIRQLCKLLNADMARRNVDHLAALLALTNAVAGR